MPGRHQPLQPSLPDVAESEGGYMSPSVRSINSPPSVTGLEGLQAVLMYLEDSEPWNLDFFEIKTISMGQPLVAAVSAALAKRSLFRHCKLDKAKLLPFLVAIENTYKHDGYHTATHAAEVVLTMHELLQRSGIELTPVQQLACILAAAAHDCEHQGFTNAYHINCEDDIALVHNDVSVLENHHAFVLFSLLRKPELAILDHWSREDKRAFRKLAISLIHATDLANGYEIVNAFVTRLDPKLRPQPRLTPGRSSLLHHGSMRDILGGGRRISIADEGAADTPVARCRKHCTDPDDVLIFLKMCIKAADLGHVIKPFNLHETWSNLLLEEFYHQGDLEKEKGFPVLPHMDRAKHSPESFHKAQVGFLEHVAIPIWEPITSTLELHSAWLNLQTNLSRWRLPSSGIDGTHSSHRRSPDMSSREQRSTELRPHGSLDLDKLSLSKPHGSNEHKPPELKLHRSLELKSSSGTHTPVRWNHGSSSPKHHGSHGSHGLDLTEVIVSESHAPVVRVASAPPRDRHFPPALDIPSPRLVSHDRPVILPGANMLPPTLPVLGQDLNTDTAPELTNFGLPELGS